LRIYSVCITEKVAVNIVSSIAEKNPSCVNCDRVPTIDCFNTCQVWLGFNNSCSNCPYIHYKNKVASLQYKLSYQCRRRSTHPLCVCSCAVPSRCAHSQQGLFLFPCIASCPSRSHLGQVHTHDLTISRNACSVQYYSIIQ